MLRRRKVNGEKILICPKCGFIPNGSEKKSKKETVKKRVSAELALFPFPKIRDGQKEFLEDARSAINEGKHIIVHAPTGIGKTAAALSAALEYAMKNNKIVFFLTSKQSQHYIAIETLRSMNEKLIKEEGTDIVAVDVISKQSMCPLSSTRSVYGAFNEFCRLKVKTRSCEYFKNHNEAVVNKIKGKIMHVQQLVKLCKVYGTCPHKTALDAGHDANIIVCDYSYIFSDIREVILPKIGKELNDIVLVVDEAHNLPDRIRSYLSSSLTSIELNKAEKEIKKKNAAIARHLHNLAAICESIFNEVEDNKEKKLEKDELIKRIEDTLKESLEKWNYDFFIEALTKAGEKMLKENEATSLLDIAAFLDGWRKHKTGVVRTVSKKDVARISYTLLDPSILSEEVFSQAHSSILMSGTLYPGEMYADLLAIEESRRIIKSYRSPFPRENRIVLMTNNLTTLYKKRGLRMFQAYANRIAEASKHIQGNVAVFFPSYGLLHEVLGRLDNIYLTKRLLIEKQGLRKEEKERLIEELRSLKKGEGGILMGVQGGSLSEGIDYEDNLLSAVFIIGLPLSPPSIETEALKEYYMKKFSAEKGYYYSYIYPAINKVMQAAGRCIRSEEDKGVIILMDERFKQSRYAKCFPEDFKFNTSDNINNQLKQFFRSKG